MGRSQRFLSVALALIIMGLVVWSTPNTSATASVGGVLRFPTSDPVEGTLDPARITYGDEWAIAQQLFEGLAQIDQNGSVVPAIASSWQISSDARVYTFTLRNDVTFHNGRQVKANDFVYAWNRAKSLGGGYTGVFNSISSFIAPSDFTLVVTLTGPQSSFLARTTLPVFAVIPSEAAGTIGTVPVGTGPFKFVSWTHAIGGMGGKITLQKNAQYWGGAPFLDGVEYTFYNNDPNAEWVAFQSGDLDVTRIPTSTWSSVQSDPNVITGSVMLMIGFGIDNSAFPDVRVRQALQQAINRAGIATDPTLAAYGALPLAHGVVSPGKGSYDNSDINIAYDPPNALALLAAAGWTDHNADGILDDGAGRNLTVNLLRSGNPVMSQRIANDLTNIGGSGVGATVVITTNRNAPGLNMQSVGWGSDYPDPENDLMMYASGGFNASRLHYSSSAFNAFYNAGLASSDTATRNAAFHSADYQVVITDATVLPLYYPPMTPVLTKPYVHGLQYSKLVGHPSAPLKDVWLDSSPIPVITALSRTSAAAGDPGFTLTITGTGFTATSSVRWNGASRSTTFVSPAQLTASIPAADLTTSGPISITVTNSSPSGVSNTVMFYVTATGAGVTAASTVTGYNPVVTTGAVNSVTATGTGAGTLSVAQYASNPGGAVTFSSAGAYIDVHIAPGSSFTSLTIVDCNLNGANKVYWWNGSAWQLASNQTYNASTQCVTITVNATTSPSLSQLYGTVFGAAGDGRLYLPLLRR